MILISLLWFFAAMKKQEQAEKSLQPVGQEKPQAKTGYTFHSSCFDLCIMVLSGISGDMFDLCRTINTCSDNLRTT